MKSAAVSKLRATLSEHLARVKAGEEVVVTERGKPIARIVPLGRLGSGKLPRRFWRMSRPSDPRGAGLKALLEEREGGR